MAAALILYPAPENASAAAKPSQTRAFSGGFFVNDAFFFALCAALSALGIAALFLHGAQAQPQRAEISELGGLEGRFVEVSGEVRGAYSKNGTLVITLCAGECIRAVVFRGEVERVGREEPAIYVLRKGAHAKISGTVDSYGGEPGIIAETVSVSG
jgi:hypothetical protein